MSHAPLQQALSDNELDKLAEFLEGIGSPAMNIEMLDGYLVALICGPDNVLPIDYLPHIWGPDFAFSDERQANDMIGLILRHWNAILSPLRRSLVEPDVYMPVLLQDETGVAHGNDWAHGFMRGVGTRPGSWTDMINDDESAGPLVPIMMLAHEHDSDPSLRPPPITADKRDTILQMMIGGLPAIYRFFEPHRLSPATGRSPAPRRREGPKIGRNDACPCGSDKKFKHCCGATQLFH
jgi:uncharacterized protein